MQQACDQNVSVMTLLPSAMPRSTPTQSVPRPSLHLIQMTTSPERLLLHHHVLPTTQQLLVYIQTD